MFEMRAKEENHLDIRKGRKKKETERDRGEKTVSKRFRSS
jgi:hypothetical protein